MNSNSLVIKQKNQTNKQKYVNEDFKTQVKD